MSVIDNYLKDLNPTQREGLERVRRIVVAAVPEAEEVISYGMPGFKVDKKYLITFGAFKDHLSLFPAARPVEVVKDKLDGFTLTKGSIHFTTEQPVPEVLIRELVEIRLHDIKNA